MYYISKIESLLMSKKITIVELSNKIGMSRHGLTRAIREDTLRVKVLIDIAKYCNVPATYFFDDNINLEDKRAEKEQMIDEVFAIIKDILKERIK